MPLLDLLREGPVTQALALERLKCFNVAAEIKRLRQQGHDIKQFVKAHKGKLVVEYHLKGK